LSEAKGGIAGIVLAAGEGKRFGGPKAPFVHEGERLVDRSVRILNEAGCNPIVVVLGAWLGEVTGATLVTNNAWREGMGSSLRAGLGWVQTHTSADYALITLVDLPGLTSTAIERVMGAPEGIAAAQFDGERGHPVRIPRTHFPELLDSVSGDQGARGFLRDRSDVLFIEVADVADGTDLDEQPS
jgi:nicotine blue oxidoreductase